MLKKTEENTSH